MAAHQSVPIVKTVAFSRWRATFSQTGSDSSPDSRKRNIIGSKSPVRPR
jgi:hypothetical protein